MAKHQGPHGHLWRLIIDEQAHLGLNLPICRTGPAAFSAWTTWGCSPQQESHPPIKHTPNRSQYVFQIFPIFSIPRYPPWFLGLCLTGGMGFSNLQPSPQGARDASPPNEESDGERNSQNAQGWKHCCDVRQRPDLQRWTRAKGELYFLKEFEKTSNEAGWII